jgi:CRP/FNR family transcriptional regulator, dissimilatory nitrate respiration regulator
MNEAQLIAAVKSVPAFSALDDLALAELAAAGQTRRVKVGETIFRDGQPADALYVVLDGSVKIFRLSPKGDQQILHLYGPGQTFAEAAVWAGRAYPASAEAVTETHLLLIPRTTVEQTIRKDPGAALAMLAGMSRKLQEFADLIDDLSLKDVPARLAGVLVAEAKRADAFTFQLRQSKRELAAQIAAAPETLSRALKKLTADGLIDVDGPNISLLDLPALQALCKGE